MKFAAFRGLLGSRTATPRARTILRTVLLVAGLAAVLSSALANPGAHGPNGEHLDAPGAGAGNATGLARLPDGSVNVPMAAQRRMAIRTRLSPLTEAAATVQLMGRVINDPNRGGLVQAASGGRIEPGPNGLPVVGQRVAQGEVLAYLRYVADPYASANQQAQLAQLRSERQLAAQRVERLQSLQGSVPRKDLEEARAQLAALVSGERSVGASVGREALRAPVTGVIASAEAIAGQVVDARQVLYQIVDPQRLMVEAVTADPALGTSIAGAHLQEVPQAKLALLGAARSLRDGVLPLTFSVSSADAPLPLAVGQPVTVLAALNVKSKGFVLPAQSVVRNSANEPVVWIKSGAERYIPQPVQVQPLDGATVLVTQGLGDENRVVVEGAALLAQIR